MTPEQKLDALRAAAENLKQQISEKEATRVELVLDISEKKNLLNQHNQAIARLEAQMASRPPENEVRVSDHAVLRYIERVLGVDVEAMRANILTDRNRKAIEFAGNCKIRSADGVELVVKDRVVVTVIADGDGK